MFRLGVVLTTLAVLFSLTAFAFLAAGRLRHAVLTAAALTATLATGLAFLID
jgi:hypothetical protein